MTAGGPGRVVAAIGAAQDDLIREPRDLESDSTVSRTKETSRDSNRGQATISLVEASLIADRKHSPD